MAHLLVGAEDDPVILVAVKADGQREPQLATLCLVADAAVEAGAYQVQLCLRHRPLQSQQQAVVEVRRE